MYNLQHQVIVTIRKRTNYKQCCNRDAPARHWDDNDSKSFDVIGDLCVDVIDLNASCLFLCLKCVCLCCDRFGSTAFFRCCFCFLLCNVYPCQMEWLVKMQSFYVSCQSRCDGFCISSMWCVVLLFGVFVDDFVLDEEKKNIIPDGCCLVRESVDCFFFLLHSMWQTPPFESHSFCVNKLSAHEQFVDEQAIKMRSVAQHFHEEMLWVCRFWSSLNLWCHFWLIAIAWHGMAWVLLSSNCHIQLLLASKLIVVILIEPIVLFISSMVGCVRERAHNMLAFMREFCYVADPQWSEK